MRDCVLVISKVAFKRAPQITVHVLQLHEEKRQAVNEPYDVGAATIERALDPELANAQEVICFRIAKIEDPQTCSLQPCFVTVRHEHAVSHKVVFLAISMQ